LQIDVKFFGSVNHYTEVFIRKKSSPLE